MQKSRVYETENQKIYYNAINFYKKHLKKKCKICIMIMVIMGDFGIILAL